MVTPTRHSARRPDWRLTAVAAAVLSLGFAGAASAEDAKPLIESTVTVGGVVASGDPLDRALFGQYNDLREDRWALYLGFDYFFEDEAAGTRATVTGFDLLRDTRELELRWSKPGDWSLAAALKGIVRNDPLTPSTGQELRVERTGVGLAMSKVIDPRWQFDVALSTENREGNRNFGVGMNCPSTVAPGCGGTTSAAVGWGVLTQPEPIDSNHSQIDLRVTHAGDALRISAGYYGSFFQNRLDTLTPNVPPLLRNAVGTPLPPSAGLASILGNPVALPPDNQAHQFDVTGVYRLTPEARLQFKVARTIATQDQNFAGSGLANAPAGVNDLGGRIDTTLAHLGLNWKLSPALTLFGKLHHEERDDKTPVAAYNVEGTSTYSNTLMPQKRDRALLQATYRFNDEYSGTLSGEYLGIDRGVFTPTSAISGVTALRQDTDEKTLRGELRKRLTDDLSGSLILATARRNGSNWLRDNSGTGVTPAADTDPSFSTGIFMPTVANRQRNTLSLLTNWQANEALALQLALQTGRDKYDTPSQYGLRDTDNHNLTLDATYALNSTWNLTGYATWGRETLRQAKYAASVIDYKNNSTAVGVGVTGKIDKVDVGGSWSFLNDRSTYAQTLDPFADGASAALLSATGGLPDVVFKQSLWRFFARYQLDKMSDLRADLVIQHLNWSDWSWNYAGVPYTDSAGTTMQLQPQQNVVAIGLRYAYRWR